MFYLFLFLCEFKSRNAIVNFSNTILMQTILLVMNILYHIYFIVILQNKVHTTHVTTLQFRE